MRRISLFMQSFDGGGVQTVMINLANGLLDAKFNIDFVVADARGPMKKRVDQSIKINNFKKEKYTGDFKVLFSQLKLIKFIRKEKPEVIIAAPGFSSVVAIVARMIIGSRFRLIIIVDDKLSLMKKAKIKNRVSYFIYRLVFRYSDEIVVAHKNGTLDLLNNFKLNKHNVHTIYHPLINAESISLTKPKTKILDNFAKKDDQIVISMGRLIWAKDQINLIDAFYLASQEYHKLKLIIIGCGPDLELIESRIKLYNISDKVMMYGYAENPFEILKLGNIFVLPSRFEAFGNVIVEALSCGLTVVATDCSSGGPNEILGNGKYGYLCPIENAEALAAGIIKAIESPIPPDISIKRALTFSIENSVQAYQKLIEMD